MVPSVYTIQKLQIKPKTKKIYRAVIEKQPILTSAVLWWRFFFFLHSLIVGVVSRSIQKVTLLCQIENIPWYKPLKICRCVLTSLWGVHWSVCPSVGQSEGASRVTDKISNKWDMIGENYFCTVAITLAPVYVAATTTITTAMTTSINATSASLIWVKVM